jgi:hypothetical protein
MPKLTSPSIVSIDLNGHKTRQVFIGDIMTICKTYLNKALGALQILCVDMIDHKGMVLITLNVTTHLIQ